MKINYSTKETFLPYGGKFFSKKTGIDYFDDIIESGYHLNFNENWIETKKMAELIWLRFLLWFIPIGVIAFLLTKIVSIIGEIDKKSAFTIVSLLMIIIIPFAVINIFKDLKSLPIIQTKRLYIKLLWAILLLLIIFKPMYFALSESESLYGFITDMLAILYFSIGYAFAIPIILTTGLGAWESMEISRKVVTRNWTNIATHLLISNLIMLSGLVAFGIGVLFTIPLGISYYLVIFIKVFRPQIQESNGR